MTTPNVDDVKTKTKLDYSYTAGDAWSSTIILANSLAISDKTKHVSTIQTQQLHFRHLSQRNEELCLHKNLYKMLIAALVITGRSQIEPRYLCTHYRASKP